jgi:DNA-directed RNA polymerase specialized sigma24 family protein
LATPIEEAHWVLRAQCHDRDALELLLKSVQPVLRRYVNSLIGADDADDILQDVLIIISRKVYWLEHPDVFRAWAFRIASRAAFRHLRKWKRGARAALSRRDAARARRGGAGDSARHSEVEACIRIEDFAQAPCCGGYRWHATLNFGVCRCWCGITCRA